jgi:AcrR family transcriptional regulator
MGNDQPDTRKRILNAAYELFYRQGFTRVSVDAIADRAGVTKRTVYYHFDSKDDVIAEVLEVQHLHLMRQFQDWVDAASDEPSELIVSLFSNLETWAVRPEWHGSGFTRITAELADLKGHPARRAASRHKAAVETWLSDRLTAAGYEGARTLAGQCMVLLEGCMSLALIHGDTGYIATAKAAALRLAYSSKA